MDISDPAVIAFLTALITTLIASPITAYIGYRLGRKTKLDEMRIKACDDIYFLILEALALRQKLIDGFETRDIQKIEEMQSEMKLILSNKELRRAMAEADLRINNKRIDEQITKITKLYNITPEYKTNQIQEEINQEIAKAKLIKIEIEKEMETLKKMMNKKYFT